MTSPVMMSDEWNRRCEIECGKLEEVGENHILNPPLDEDGSLLCSACGMIIRFPPALRPALPPLRLGIVG
jgi:hypothetical protein